LRSARKDLRSARQFRVLRFWILGSKFSSLARY